MPLEIERKFKVKNLQWLTDGEFTRKHISQGYLSFGNGHNIRVRIVDDESAYLTIKGSRNGTATCSEYEYAIPLTDANELYSTCQFKISKHRYYRDAGNGLCWEIDVFDEVNAGLIVAEIELPSEDTQFDIPSWLGEEVTYDNTYTNISLAMNPKPVEECMRSGI